MFVEYIYSTNIPYIDTIIENNQLESPISINLLDCQNIQDSLQLLLMYLERLWTVYAAKLRYAFSSPQKRKQSFAYITFVSRI